MRRLAQRNGKHSTESSSTDLFVNSGSPVADLFSYGAATVLQNANRAGGYTPYYSSALAKADIELYEITDYRAKQYKKASGTYVKHSEGSNTLEAVIMNYILTNFITTFFKL